MAILSASVIIQSLSTTHLILAYFLLTAPAVIADLNLVFILGAAMDLVLFPPCPSFPLFPLRRTQSHPPPPTLYYPLRAIQVITKLTATFSTRRSPHHHHPSPPHPQPQPSWRQSWLYPHSPTSRPLPFRGKSRGFTGVRKRLSGYHFSSSLRPIRLRLNRAEWA